jgi:hypothetical protein
MGTKTDLEDALQAWAKSTAGVEAFWVRQKVKGPAAGWLTLHLDGPRTLSQQPERWHDFVGSSEVPGPLPGELNPPGEEIQHSARDNESWSLQIQAYTKNNTGEADSASLLRRLKNSLKLQGTLATLRAASITVAEVGDIHDVSVVIETEWQDRAAMTILLWTADVSTERTTFIETAEGQGEGDLAPTTI